MRIAVVNNWVPFLAGGAEHLAEALTSKLIEHGHEALLVRIPFQWNPPEKAIESLFACKLLCFDWFDRVIPLKFPVYSVDHPEKVLWLVHQFRQAYDFWGTPFQHIPDTAEGHGIRDVIVRSDNETFSRVRKIYTNSSVTSNRLKKFNGFDSEVLYPPLLKSEHFVSGESGDYLFYPSRINRTKRQYLAIEAMAHVETGVKLVIAGKPEAQEDLIELEGLIGRLNLRDRVTLIPRFISEAEKVDLMASALGCIYIPYDEDSYGYVTMEAYHARKPVITCDDSGGTSVLVTNEETGYSTPPDPWELARAMDRLYGNKTRARAMGDAGFQKMSELRISWERVIECLTSRV
jgi:glycosyltransferase involved in cell wall biosynthesis